MDFGHTMLTYFVCNYCLWIDKISNTCFENFGYHKVYYAANRVIRFLIFNGKPRCSFFFCWSSTWEEIIHICTIVIFESTAKKGLSKIELKAVWCLYTKESYFVFNGNLYGLVDEVTMGWALGPIVSFGFHFLLTLRRTDCSVVHQILGLITSAMLMTLLFWLT